MQKINSIPAKMSTGAQGDLRGKEQVQEGGRNQLWGAQAGPSAAEVPVCPQGGGKGEDGDGMVIFLCLI